MLLVPRFGRARFFIPVVAAAAFLACPGHSAHAQPITPDGPIYEDWLDTVPVSGFGLLQGAMYGRPHGRPQPPYVTIYLPREMSGHLCLSILSQDGRYVARAPLRMNHAKAGAYTIDLKLRRAGNLNGRYEGAGTAILATVGKACPYQGDNVTIVPAHWGRRHDLNKRVISLLVNSGGGDIYVAFKDKAGQPRTIPCRYVRGGSLPRTAYNEICELDLRRVDPSELFLDQYVHTTPIGSLEIELAVPQ